MLIRFRLDVALMPKARPRVPRRGKAYMPDSYDDWREEVRGLLTAIWAEKGLTTLDRFHLHVVAHGPGRADGDNLLGALLDAGLPHKKTGWPGAWKDDRVTRLPFFTFRWVSSKDAFWDVKIRPLSC